MLIFAFGSNLSAEQMARRCPGGVFVGPAKLERHRLAFGSYSSRWGGGVATVLRSKSQSVSGVLYSLTDRDVRSLDTYEGHPVCYKREEGQVLWNDKPVTAQWYKLMALDRPFMPPSARYLAVIASGYSAHRFSKDDLHEALRFTQARMLRDLRDPKRAGMYVDNARRGVRQMLSSSHVVRTPNGFKRVSSFEEFMAMKDEAKKKKLG